MPKKISKTNNKAKQTNSRIRKPRTKKIQHFSRLRGMKDILFAEAKYWEIIERKASDMAAYYGFNPDELYSDFLCTPKH